jgi:hypothetical protein
MEMEVSTKSQARGDNERSSKPDSLGSHGTNECSGPEGERTLQQWLRDYDVQVAALGRS